jgi:hypothetical protein
VAPAVALAASLLPILLYQRLATELLDHLPESIVVDHPT